MSDRHDILTFVVTLARDVTRDDEVSEESWLSDLELESLDWTEIQARVKDEYGVELANCERRTDASEPLALPFQTLDDVVDYIHDEIRKRANGARVFA